MKTCSKCKRTKVAGEFNKNSSRKDGLQTFCRPCEKQRKSEYYAKHKQRFVDYARAYKARKREWWNQYKQTLSCIRCGDTRWYVLDFHHRDPASKDFPLSEVDKFGIQRIMKEVEKCDVLCANCHREHHHFEIQ